MKKSLILCAFSMLSLINLSAIGFVKVYDSYVQMYVTAQKTVQKGEDFTINVTFRQTSMTFPFNKNGDMASVPFFPNIDGLDRLGAPTVINTTDETKKDGKTSSKTYSSTFIYKMNAAKAGLYTINNVQIKFRGYTIKADETAIEVIASSINSPEPPELIDTIPILIEEEVLEYKNPFVARATDPGSVVECVRVFDDRTEVDLFYTARGGGVWVSSECYIEDSDSKDRVKLRLVRGDVGFEKRTVGAGTKLNYTLVFPPIDKSWRNVNILENVSGGFSFYGVGLSAKRDQERSDKKVRKQIEQVNWSDMRKVELNNYSSNFLFTDGLLPVYNKDTYKWGFFDEKGNQVIPFAWDYDNFRCPQFGGGSCIVSKVKRVNGIMQTDYFVINRVGQPIKLQGVVKVTPFCDGVAVVVKHDGRLIYIKGNGSEVFPALSEYIGSQEPKAARPFKDGLSAYYDYSKRKYGFINKQGGKVISAKYDKVHDFSEGLAAVLVPETSGSAAKWGFINTRGVMEIEAQYSYEPSSFSLDHAVVIKRSGLKVMINKEGEVVSPEFYDLFPFFSTGFTLAHLTSGQGYFVIDNDYRVVAGPVYGIDRKHEYKEYQGAFQLPIFSDGSSSYTYLTTGEFLFKDSSWKTVGMMSERLIHFEGKEGHGFVDYSGNVVFQFVQSEF